MGNPGIRNVPHFDGTKLITGWQVDPPLRVMIYVGNYSLIYAGKETFVRMVIVRV